MVRRLAPLFVFVALGLAGCASDTQDPPQDDSGSSSSALVLSDGPSFDCGDGAPAFERAPQRVGLRLEPTVEIHREQSPPSSGAEALDGSELAIGEYWTVDAVISNDAPTTINAWLRDNDPPLFW